MDLLTFSSIVLPLITLLLLTLHTNFEYRQALKNGRTDKDMAMFINREMPVKTLKIYAITLNVMTVLYCCLIIAAIITKLARASS